MDKTALLLIASIAAVIFVAGCTSTSTQSPPPASPGCTLETKQCPDGSSVSREGPNCEFAACPQPPPPTGYTIKTSSKQGISSYLVDSNGMTLYYFTRDTQGTASSNPTSICAGGCNEIWPVFYTGTINVPSDLKTSDISSFARQGGDMQTTYKGWPLYYYYLDKQPSDTKGQGVNGVWFIINPTAV